MAITHHRGNPVNLIGELPAVGSTAPDFIYVKSDLTEAKLSDLQAKVKILIAVPSLDTGVCQLETRQFNQQLAGKEGVEALVISEDLPFAMKRFCETEGIANVQSASDFRYRQFIQSYHTEMADGKLKGLSARAVFVLDKNNVIRLSLLTNDITEEPDYAEVMAAVDSLLKA